jgi:hypothetical protein
MIEAFIPGVEVALDGVLSGGVLQVLAVFDKPDPLDGPYFEETLFITPSRLPQATQREFADAVARACGAGGRDGRRGACRGAHQRRRRVAARNRAARHRRFVRAGAGCHARHEQCGDRAAPRRWPAAADAGERQRRRRDDDPDSGQRNFAGRRRPRLPRAAVPNISGIEITAPIARPAGRAAPRRRGLPRFHLQPRRDASSKPKLHCARAHAALAVRIQPLVDA